MSNQPVKSRSATNAWWLGPVMFGLPVVALAQGATLDVAVLRGDGARLDGHTVEVRNAGTGYTRRMLTSAQGRAHFEAVPAAEGYQVYLDGAPASEPIALRADESRSVAVGLLDTVVVSATRAATSTKLGAEVSADLDREQLAALPIEARDLSGALVRLPGVSASTGFFPEAPSVSINGANGLYTQYLLDGADNNENFLGGPKYPISIGSVQNVTVLTGSYSAEYGRSGNGVVNVTTRSGTNEWTGEAFVLDRPGPSTDASSAYPGRDLSGNAVKDGFRREQGGLSVGGPLFANQTFFFANLEYSRDRKDNLLVSPQLGVADSVPGRNHSLLGFARIDHRFSEEWTTSLRVNRGDVSIERQGGGLDGGVTFPSAGSTQDRISNEISATATYSGQRMTSTTTVGLNTFGWNYARNASGPGPQVTLLAPDGQVAAVLGNPGYVFDDFERSWQVQQKFTWNLGRHALKSGVDLLYSNFALAGGGNPAGNYTVQASAADMDAIVGLARGSALSVSDIPRDVQVTDYNVELRPATFGQPQRQAGVYLEDQVSVTNALTISAGLRWDYDSLTKAGADHADFGNVAPRFSVNWRASPTLSVRGGFGMYYDRIPYTVLSDALQQNTTSPAFRNQLQQLVEAGVLPKGTSVDRVTFAGNLSVSPACPLGYLNCPTAATSAGLRNTASLNEARILNPSGLKSPYTFQWSAGLQWNVTERVVASGDLQLALGRHQLRLRDLNAPTPFTPDLANLTAANIAMLRAIGDLAARQLAAEALGLVRSQAAADATRPVAVIAGGARQIILTESEGKSRYEALMLRWERSHRQGDRFGYLFSYTLSSLENNTDDLNFRASNANAFSQEWGPSINDRRHLLSTVLLLYPTESLTISLAGLAQSGQPVNYIPDATIYGTTDIYGDGRSFSDSYLGNAARAPGVTRNSGRLPWAKTVDLAVRYAPSLGRGRMEFSMDVFNLFNSTNLTGYANAATQSNQIQVYGQSFQQRNAGPPRQFQFGARYSF